MKLSTICFSAFISLTSLSATAIDFSSLTKSSSEQLKTAAKEAGIPLDTSAMIDFAAKQLNLSKETVSGGLGSLLKVAQDNLSAENFALISKAVPNAQNYVDQAPEVSTSSISSFFSSASETGEKAASMDYLNSAFEKLGMSSDDIPGLVSSFTSYLDKSGYAEAAATLKQGLSLL